MGQGSAPDSDDRPFPKDNVRHARTFDSDPFKRGPDVSAALGGKDSRVPTLTPRRDRLIACEDTLR